jgi:hypothetical protein
MSGLTDEAGGLHFEGNKTIEEARQAWQESMLRQLDLLRASLRELEPRLVADRCGGVYEADSLRLAYWGEIVSITWSDLEAVKAKDGDPCSTFDTAMLLYYLNTADGAPMADRWVGYRELPNGSFYHQAFQGYSGDKLARAFGERPEDFTYAAHALRGEHLPALASFAYMFTPLPRIRLAAVLWPGDEEFASRASILFDAAAHHYMVIDGLALLGAGLAGRLIRVWKTAQSDK